MTLSSVKVVKSDNRIMIVIDNPSQNDISAVEQAFGAAGAIKELAGIKTPVDPEPQIPQVQQPVPQAASVQQPIQQPVQEAPGNPVSEMKKLIADKGLQNTLGARETLWRMGLLVHPNSNKEVFDSWFDKSSKDQHQNTFTELANCIMAMPG